jgi:hypothetical protein
MTSQKSRIQDLLSLSLGSSTRSDALIASLTSAGPQGRADFLALAHDHHVILRALEPLRIQAREQGNDEVAWWCEEALRGERARIAKALYFLANICSALEAAEIQITVMKSLDHWPDIGNDLDLYTPSNEEKVRSAMQGSFGALAKGRTWGDRLAHKWGFGVQGLRETVEIHHGCLGQTGEHVRLAKRFHARRVPIEVGEYTFMVPAPEERILAATLQRMYRHLYIRACDIVNTHALLQSGNLDLEELRTAAELSGIWPGVATYLRIVTEFVVQFRGSAYTLDRRILAASHFGLEEVFVRGKWLRVPASRAAFLYSRELGAMASRLDLRGLLRLSMLPPLASAARLSYMLTGNHSGIW